jgi:hypothetical protein
MAGSAYLEVAIGVIYIFLVYSLIASAFQESISSLLQWRSSALKAGVKQILGPHIEKFWSTPVIESLKGPAWSMLSWNSTGRRDPSYIPPNLFAKALLTEFELDKVDPADIRDKLKEVFKDSEEAKRLETVLTNVKDDLEAIEVALAKYFDQVMDRVSGWYVRRVKVFLFLIGLALAAATNFNVISYAKHLAENSEARAAVVTAAEGAAAIGEIAELENTLKGEVDLTNEVSTLVTKLQTYIEQESGSKNAPNVGYGSCKEQNLGTVDCIQRVVLTDLGLFTWILLAMATTLGAQFWFDLLKNLVRVRSTGVEVRAASESSQVSS